MPKEFQHVEFSAINLGWLRKNRGFPGGETNPRTLRNLSNRTEHGQGLKGALGGTKNAWIGYIRESGLGELLSEAEMPLFFQVDTNFISIESLKWLGIELVSEEENGYIIGSSISIETLEKKINDFLLMNGRSKDQAAKLWSIDEWIQWRKKWILSPELYEAWDRIGDETTYEIEVGVACQSILLKSRKAKESMEDYLKREEQWYNENDQKQITRQDQLEEIVKAYEGVVSDTVLLDDSFCCEITISWKGLKDLTMTYPFAFEIKLKDEIETLFQWDADIYSSSINALNAPTPEAASVCLIDSWIQEGHVFLDSAVRHTKSRSYVPGDASVWDMGNHGTRVAWVMTYPLWISGGGTHQAICWLENARILTGVNNQIPAGLMPAQLMKNVVSDFHDKSTRIFNLSVNSSSPFRLIHNSSWGTSIDELIYEHDLLFVISSWNLGYPLVHHYVGQNRYPNYLHEAECRIANPWQSLFWITVGSICPNGFDTANERSVAPKDHISSFSRIGPWIWNSIKPELVEYGGEFVTDKINPSGLRSKSATSVETTNSTLSGARAFSKDAIGTSYAVPKVIHILAQLQNSFQEKTALFYKALLIQSARWPDVISLLDDKEENSRLLARYWYWLPSLERALQNNANRITFIDDSKMVTCNRANIYAIHVPAEIRRPSVESKILIEVTLVYKAKPRRTRRKTKSYLSMWMSWVASKPWETIEAFRSRVTVMQQSEGAEWQEDLPSQRNSFRWAIQEQWNHWRIADVGRNDSATQKDWTVVNSWELPDSFFIGVVGHNGWEKNPENEYPYALAISFESIDGTIQIYEQMLEVNQVHVETEAEIGDIF